MNKNIIFMGFFLLIAFSVFSQSINLEQARELGLINSRSLARYEMQIRSSILDERSQLYAMLPQISAGYSASMQFLKDWQFVNPIEEYSIGANLSITQIIFQGGKNFVQKAIAKIATESVRIDARNEYFNVIDSVDNAYYSVLEAKAALEAEEMSLRAAEIGHSIAEVRQMSGMINQGDYLKALADKEARENSRNQARRNLTLAGNKFKSLIGIDGNLELEQISFDNYNDILSRLGTITDEQADALFEIFWDIIIDSNLSLAKAAINTERAKRNYTLAKRDWTPTITASLLSSDFNFLPSFRTSGSMSVSLRGTIPIDFWVLTNRLEKSRISRDSANIDYTNTEDALEHELLNSLYNIFSQAGTVLSARRSLEYTEKHFEYVMQRYRLSQSSVSELNDATSLFINSRNSLNRASYGFLQNLSKLRTLCSIDDEAELLELLTLR
ncbi:MAG: TolC family protein [Treponema sp.]|nr:TolC family protein [Treponema sp.]